MQSLQHQMFKQLQAFICPKPMSEPIPLCLQVPNTLIRVPIDNTLGVQSLQREVARFMFEMLPPNVEKSSSDLAVALSEDCSAAQLPSEQVLVYGIDQMLLQPEIAVRMLGSSIGAISPQQVVEAHTLQLQMVVQTIKKLLTTHATPGFASTAQHLLLLVPQAVSVLDASGTAALLDVLKSASCNSSNLQAVFDSGINVEVCQSALQLLTLSFDLHILTVSLCQAVATLYCSFAVTLPHLTLWSQHACCKRTCGCLA